LPTAPSIRGTLNPHVGVEHADRAAGLREGGREVHRDTGLADAALARGDRDDRGLRRERDRGLRGGGGTAAEPRDQLLPLLRAHRRELDIDALHALERLDGGGHVARDPVLERTSFDGEEDVDPDDATVHVDGPQHADLVDGSADLRVLDALQRLADLCFRGHGLSSFRGLSSG